MKLLTLEKGPAQKERVGQPVDPNEARDWTLITPDTTVICSGRPMLVYGRMDEGEKLSGVSEMFTRIKFSKGQRLGKSSAFNRKRPDLVKTIDFQFGHRPQREVYGLPAGPCKFNSEHPAYYAALAKMADELDGKYRTHDPVRYAQHVEKLSGVPTDCRIGSSIFTQGVCNKANILPYHYDAGNFPDTWSAMIYFCRDMQGGDLLLPELGARLAVEDNTYVLFDGQGTLHGVSPARGTRPGAYRYSVVYYALRLMNRVGTPQERVEKIRRADMAKHLKRLEQK